MWLGSLGWGHFPCLMKTKSSQCHDMWLREAWFCAASHGSFCWMTSAISVNLLFSPLISGLLGGALQHFAGKFCSIGRFDLVSVKHATYWGIPCGVDIVSSVVVNKSNEVNKNKIINKNKCCGFIYHVQKYCIMLCDHIQNLYVLRVVKFSCEHSVI